MNRNTTVFLAVGTLAALGLYLYSRNKTANAAADASGVTTTSKGGVTTTPIQTRTVALISDGTSALANLARQVVQLPSQAFQGGSWNRLFPWGNKQTADAAATATLRPDYVPTTRAVDNVVYLPGVL